MRACYDIDFILFAAASVAEEKYITAVHTPTGMELELENRTQLWGHHGKKSGGWIGDQNDLSQNDYYKASDFVVTECQRPRPFRIKGKDGEPDTFLSPLEGAKKAVTDQINAINGKLKVDSYFGFTGRGDVFRHDKASLLPYKGNRTGLTPLVLDELKTWACEAHNITLVSGIEADDACSMSTVAAYKVWVAGGKEDDDDIVIQVAIDKDSKQTNGWHFNPNKDEQPRLIEGFGSLWLDKKGDPDGCGRMWLYWQIAHGDDTDGYIANCFSDVKYAGKGAYNDLKDCKTDKEAFTKLVEIFKRLYPETKFVKSFRGDMRIDAMYVFQEMATMAMMLRHEGDSINVKAVCGKLGINYE